MADEHEHDAQEHPIPEPGEEVVDQQLQEEFDQLLNVGIDVAQQLLEEEGGFMPFAVTITREGETQVLMLEEDDGDGEEVVEALLEELAEHRDELVGAALVSDVLLDDDQDAIRVDLEHSELATEAMVMALAYSVADGEHEYGELLGSVGERRIWT